MFVVTVEFEARREQAEAFTRRVLRQAEDSLRKETDCHRFDVCRDQERPWRLFLYEVYADESAFRDHLRSAHFRAFDDEVAAWVEDKRVATYERLPSAD